MDSTMNFNVNVPTFANVAVNVLDKGARPYSYTLEDAKDNAQCINKTIEDVSDNGGGTVVIPAGIWYTAPIELKSDVCLKLEKNCILKFSKDISQYPLIATNYEGQECIRTISPVSAKDAKNIAITGEGTIDGSGDLWRPIKQIKLTERQWNALQKKSQYVIDTKEGGIWFPTESAYEGNKANVKLSDENSLEKAAQFYDFYRPVMISLKNCDSILLEGVTFMNSPAWNIHPHFCTNLTVRNVKVNNPYHAQNGDGIDVESCKNVHIHDNLFETGDDAICLKSGKNAEARVVEGPCENVYIHDCVVNNGHGGFVIGSEMSRGVKNVWVSDCTFIGTDVGVRMKSALGRGGVVENINIANINMTDIKEEAIILTMSYVLNSLNRNEEIAGINQEDVPYFKNIIMKNINCMGAKTAVKIEPLKDMPETITDIRIVDSSFTAEQDNIIIGNALSSENTRYILQVGK